MLLDKFRKDAQYTPYVNTGTLFDLATGQYRLGGDGSWVLDGGLSQCLGITGRAQTFKSSLAGSLMAHTLLCHPQAEDYVYETEGAIADQFRYDNFTPIDQPVSDRITFRSSSDMNLTDAYEVFKEIADEKLKHKDDYTVESPIRNPHTGKPCRVWIPTVFMIDSFSRARTSKGDEQFDDNSVDDSSMNTIYLSEGNIKNRIMNDLPTRASEAGIYTILTAHVGTKFDLNPYQPTPKQLQYMKNTDKMKNVGSNFEFLTTTLIQTMKASLKQNPSTKQCEYPVEGSPDVEVSEVETVLMRCKNNASGTKLPFVVSQFQGVLDTVTNFNFLRIYKDFGLNIRGNKQAFAPILAPEKFVTKNNLRTVSESDYQLRRALEIIAQLCFVQNLWSTQRMPNYVRMPVEQLAERLANGTNLTTDRVLNSVGYWSTSKIDRERLSLMDILSIVDADDTHPVTSVPSAPAKKETPSKATKSAKK